MEKDAIKRLRKAITNRSYMSFCIKSGTPLNIDDYVPFVIEPALTQRISDWREECDGPIAMNDIKQPFPHMALILGVGEHAMYFIITERDDYTKQVSIFFEFKGMWHEPVCCKITEQDGCAHCEWENTKQPECKTVEQLLKDPVVSFLCYLNTVKDVTVELDEYPEFVQSSRKKHGKPPLPAIRRIKPGAVHAKWGREGSHTPKCPHPRRGTWRRLADGRKTWVRDCKIHGGGDTLPVYLVEPPTPTQW